MDKPRNPEAQDHLTRMEESTESTTTLLLVIDHDPDPDMGLLRQFGHRFCYSVEEVEPLPENKTE